MSEQPNLGLATTRELMQEVIARMDVTGCEEGRLDALGLLFLMEAHRHADYRTTDGVVEDGMISQFRNMEQVEPQRERSANDYQPGGDHYRRGGSFQHWDFVAKAGLDYYQGNATKYITRHRHKKGAVQDLEKALHYIAKARELKVVNRGDTAYLADFAKANNLNPLEQEAIHLIMICNWVAAENTITGLLTIAGEALQHQQV